MRFSVHVLILLCFATFLIALSVVPGSIAQTKTAGISGSVTDPQGSAIAEAQISAESIPLSGVPVKSVSSSDGRFSLTIAPGRYRVTITRDSFAPASQEITIATGETRELQIRLALEPLSSKVVVTAQALPLNAESSPAPLTTLTHEQIEQRVATSLPDLLATQPGFSLGRTGPEGGSASLFLDGGNSNYTKVLVDGVPANTPGGLIDFSNFTVDNIDKIEIVHGAESALYGSDAMDGVIQIFTHRGTTRIPVFTAFADGGNFATGHGGAELSGLLGRFDYSTGVSDLETDGQGPNDAFRNRTLSGNFGWRVSDTAHIALFLRDNDSKAGTPGQSLLPAGPNLTDTIALRNFSAGLHADFTTGSHWHHQLSSTETYFPRIQFRSLFPILLSVQPRRVRGTVHIPAQKDSESPPGTNMKSKTDFSAPLLIWAKACRKLTRAGIIRPAFLDVKLDAHCEAYAERRGARRRQRRIWHTAFAARGRILCPADCSRRIWRYAPARILWTGYRGTAGSIRPTAPTPAFPAILICFPTRAERFTPGLNKNWLRTAFVSRRIILTAASTTSSAS